MLGVFLFVQNILIGWVIVRQYVLLDAHQDGPLPDSGLASGHSDP
jgi:hypothetical protein